jgi:hypothetical protein
MARWANNACPKNPGDKRFRLRFLCVNSDCIGLA